MTAQELLERNGHQALGLQARPALPDMSAMLGQAPQGGGDMDDAIPF